MSGPRKPKIRIECPPSGKWRLYINDVRVPYEELNITEEVSIARAGLETTVTGRTLKLIDVTFKTRDVEVLAVPR